MAAHQYNSQGAGATNITASRRSLKDLSKSSVFTSNLPADAAFSTPRESHAAPRDQLGPRMVRGALFTYVRPEGTEEPELLGVSPTALSDLGVDSADVESKDFLDTVSGNKILTYDAEPSEGIYPWAQCYGGYQFGSWAGQLGDGRAISLFETTNPDTGRRYELQLKGAGRTPYSRFADGKAVLRSSIREFVVSEALNALRIPSTRALSLILAPKAKVRRESTEPGAIVCRFAESWLRIGTFDLLRARGDRQVLRQLADYLAVHVYGGWDKLSAIVSTENGSNLNTTDIKADAQGTSSAESTHKTASPSVEDEFGSLSITSGISKDTIEGSGKHAQNRYARLYREICRRNAKVVALWQAYGFMNGVLNTDNTSLYGLSIDFGPFAFMDNFDPSYTPNHDDHASRYSYRNQPSIIWWNLVRLGEAFAELIGAGEWCDDPSFVKDGIPAEKKDELVDRAETVIEDAGNEFKSVFMAEYKTAMISRLGLKCFKASDFDTLFSEWLDIMEELELDFNQSFRKLGKLNLRDLDSESGREDNATIFFHADVTPSSDGKKRIAKWLDAWRARVAEDWGSSDGDSKARQEAMNSVNPNFIPKSWILDELITRVEKKGERDVLARVMNMALHPFSESWDGDLEEEKRFCGDVPKYKASMQCSCSS